MEEQNRQNGTETQVQIVRYKAARETLDKDMTYKGRPGTRRGLEDQGKQENKTVGDLQLGGPHQENLLLTKKDRPVKVLMNPNL